MDKRVIGWIVAAGLFGGCGKDGDEGEPTDPDALEAKETFWDAFHGQRYGDLPAVTDRLRAVHDREGGATGETALLLGHAQLWRLAEWGRDPSQDPGSIPGLGLGAQSAFTEATTLLPDDARIDGWLGAVEMTIGGFTGDAETTERGRARIEQGVARHPEFNLFVRALSGSALPPETPGFAAAVEDLWQTLELCVDAPIDRAAPAYDAYMELETHSGPDRVCWNTGKAPHNFEGYFWFMGDVLAKAGEPETAMALYENARLSSTYDEWPFRDDLEARIGEASSRASRHGDADPANDPELVGASAIACASCHAR